MCSKHFKEAKLLIAVHCEDEGIIKKHLEAKVQFGEDVPIEWHPKKSAEACFKSSSLAIELAKNIILAFIFSCFSEELSLFRNDIPLEDKQITSEVCIHHLWFDDSQYAQRNTQKWNPAVKSARDREQLFQALLDDRLDIIATDHAPHTLAEKTNNYFKSPSGGPLVQHALVAMLEFFHQGKITLEKIVEKMCHAPAICFQLNNRGFIRKGYAADLVLLETNSPWTVNKENILYKCGWSPFEGQQFRSKVSHTWVNGHLVYENGKFDETKKGQRLLFDR